MSNNAEDPWDVFGEEEEEEDTNEVSSGVEQSPDAQSISAMESLSLFLTQYFVKLVQLSSLSHVRILILGGKDSANSETLNNDWQAPLERRGFSLFHEASAETMVDVLLVMDEKESAVETAAVSSLVPGGIVVISSLKKDSFLKRMGEDLFDRNAIPILDATMSVFIKWPAPIQASTCPWLPTNHDIYAERKRVSEASCSLMAYERERAQQDASVPERVIQAAVQSLQTFGYCIVPGLLNPQTSQMFGEMALSDLKDAAEILKEREGVDLYEPRNSTQEPASYRELSMREDLRMDLRHGPRLNAWRGVEGSQPATFTALDTQETLGTTVTSPNHFLRGHPAVLEIVRRTMNPSDESLAPGNWGRYNFGGRGSDGSFMDLRVGPVGTIISLPGSADQAVHADTAHLMETFDCCPAHYINVFTPGKEADSAVGQTALVHGSHHLSHTAKLETDSKKMSWTQNLVRPQLTLGDVLIFDCRIVHFGLANTSPDIQRPLIYANMTQHWFSDPKNWDDRRPIFTSTESERGDLAEKLRNILHYDSCDIYVPDGESIDRAFERTTHLGIGAHQDDLEFMALHGILDCFKNDVNFFGGVTCTNGAGSARSGPYATFTDEEMKNIRRQEQRTAAQIGGYSFMVQLDHPSKHAKRESYRGTLVADITLLLEKVRPRIVYTHNPFDKHSSHVGVLLATLEAIHKLPIERRPQHLLGCEVWRGLDWLVDKDKTVQDVSLHQNLAAALNGVFDSQIAGGKRYDQAVEGRRKANATFLESHHVDKSTHVQYAIDMSALISEEVTLNEFCLEKLANFQDDVLGNLGDVGSQTNNAVPPSSERLPPQRWKMVWGATLESLALYRIWLGGLLVLELILRFRYLHPFYTDEGTLPLRLLMPTVDNIYKAVCLHCHFGQEWQQGMLLSFQIVVACFFTAGVATNLTALLSWYLYLSLTLRNTWMNYILDRYFHYLLFLSIFLPLGERYTIYGSRNKRPSNVFALYPAILAMKLLVFWIYIDAGGGKWMDHKKGWTFGADPLPALDTYARHTLAAQYMYALLGPFGLRVLTPVVVYVEILAAPVASLGNYLSSKFLVYTAVGLICALHFGIALMLRNAALLSFVACSPWWLFLPIGLSESNFHSPQLAKVKYPTKLVGIVSTLLIGGLAFGTVWLATLSSMCDQSVKHIWSTILHNRWNVFVGAEEYVSWEIAPGLLVDGSVVDVWSKSQEVSWEMPGTGAPCTSTSRPGRWRSFPYLAELQGEDAYVLWRYLCDEWDRENQVNLYPGRQLVKYNFFMLQADVLPNMSFSPTRKRHIVSFNCMETYQPEKKREAKGQNDIGGAPSSISWW